MFGSTWSWLPPRVCVDQHRDRGERQQSQDPGIAVVFQPPRMLGWAARPLDAYTPSVGHDRDRRVTDQLAAAASKGDTWLTFAAAASDILARHVAFDRCCWHS